MALVGWLSFRQRTDVRRAREGVARLGGKAEAAGDEPFLLASVDLSGKPVTDADLVLLAPLLAAARGPATLNLSRTRITDAGLKQLAVLDRTWMLQLDGDAINGSGLVHLARLGTESGDTAADVTLSLAQTPIGDDALRFLRPIVRLAELDLSGTNVTGGGLAQLHGMRLLHKLTLDGSPVDDAGLAGLDGWNTLAELNLANTRITDAGVARLITKLEGLSALYLKGTKITDASIPALAGWRKGTSLSLAGTRVSSAAIVRLKASDTLLALDLDGVTGVDDETLREMDGWRKLHTLSLQRTAVTDAGVAHLGVGLPSLERLYLTGTRVTAQAIAALKEKRPKMLIDY